MRGVRKRRKTGLAGGLEIVAVIIIIGVVAYMMMTNTRKLRTAEHEYTAKEELLERAIEEENARTEVLKEQKKYVKTDQYIEEVARDKLGLINPNEVLFKENE